MNLFKTLVFRSKTLTLLGSFFLSLSIVLIILIPNNTTEVLGINSLIKPLKFSLSLWIYSWTMAYLIYYFKDELVKKRLIFLIVFVMLFEQAVITVQAFRGTLSHFNAETVIEGVLFSLMGIFITLVTCYTLYAALKFRNQKDTLDSAKKAAIFYGLLIFVIASFMGGVMGALFSHNVGGDMGGEGLPLVNWSTKIGDIRVAHFIGMHALQIVPLAGFYISKKIVDKRKALAYVNRFSLAYLIFVLVVFIQALLGLPFLKF
ncbi:hypothetical protein JQC67_13495 [Aurantibacter crassamenti]|uniref:hypothetical protein n=1 Tax=Aurantibacter crassamenti TaxID=1837375 RepID=UPI001939C65E|nr:hypothetical protein [Aurantibacter crassamenti]MBM1107162.1 hypothetical protein [Aurantibacter crassamenti]